MPVNRYSRIAMLFHWVVAAMMIVNVVLALTWDFYPDDAVRPAIDVHKSIGVTVLGLAVMRILWRFTHRPPATPDHHKSWERTLAMVTHWGLYALLFALPLTGWIMDSAWKDAAAHPMHWFGTFEWPRFASIMAMEPAAKLALHDQYQGYHGLAATILYLLVFLHVAGALKHQFVDKDGTLSRMWPGR